MSIDLLHSGFDQQGFRVALPPTPGVAGFRIYRDKQLLFERLAPGQAPKLGSTLASTVNTDGTRVGWNLADGPAGVTYSVRFSRDGGQTWQALAVDQTGSSIVLPPARVKGGGQTIVEVQASDGVRTDTRAYSVDAP